MRHSTAAALIAVLWALTPDPVSSGEMRVEAETGPGPVTIYLDGPITAADFNRMDARLEQIIKRKPGAPITLVLHSPGGSHFAGLRLALMLRRIGVGTVVLPGKTCLSACASIFFGGYDLKAGKPNRVAYETARVGVHRMFATKPVPGHVVSRVSTAAQRFLDDMEISPEIQRRFFDTEPTDMYFLTGAEMAASKITVRAVD